MSYRSSRTRLAALLGLALACESGCVIPLSVGDGRDNGGGSGGVGSGASDGTDGGTTSSTSTTGDGTEATDASDAGTTDASGSSSSSSSGSGSETTAGVEAPDAPDLSLAFSQVKQFDFSWSPAAGAEHYQLLESAAPGEPFVQLGDDIVGESTSISMPLCFRYEASYVLRACNAAACTASDPVGVTGTLAEAVGYFKASNNGADWFGYSIALSADGNTLAVGATREDSNATGIDGNQADDSAVNVGAVYVFVLDGMGQWSQQAYIKASNAESFDEFGRSVTLSGDGNTLAVGARDASSATGIDGNQADDSAPGAGAAYVFLRDGAGQWSQQAYVKASNTDAGDVFGRSVTLSSDGDTLAVAAVGEASNATGIDGNQADDSVESAGAAYVFVRDGLGQWSQQAYIKASNTGAEDLFGWDLALSGDGSTLAVSTSLEDSNATGIDGDQANDSLPGAGAAYVFVRDGLGQWSQQAYVKASNPGFYDRFGYSVALNGDGSTLAVGAVFEDSNATGINGDQANDSLAEAGAVYVFVRDGAGQWTQQAYVKASYDGEGTSFGGSGLALSEDGDTLAVGAINEASNAIGIGGNQAWVSEDDAGAVYVFVRDAMDQWSQQAYVKASNTDVNDYFGVDVALTGDGSTLAVSAMLEDSNAIGIGGDQANDSMVDAGAVYLY